MYGHSAGAPESRPTWTSSAWPPRVRTSFAKRETSRVLPMPGSPRISMAVPSPRAALSHSPCSWASGRARPKNGSNSGAARVAMPRPT